MEARSKEKNLGILLFMNQWAISDIHGCAKTFKALLQKIQLSRKDELYLLGDYIDRGPDSKGVIDHIWQLQEQGFTVRCLRGNHEQLALDALTDKSDRQLWMINGGVETLLSFGVSRVGELPTAYLDFMNNLAHFFETGEYILVHAGLNFDMPDPLQGLHSMLWIRRWYQDINREWLNGRIVVHGHTPQKKHEVELQFKKLAQQQVLDIDCGCVFEMKAMGHLCALNLTKRELVFQPNADR